jgi:ABC-2 type transport system permease protein
MAALCTAVQTVTGIGPAALWSRLPLASNTVIMLYGITVHALWHAPLYAWLILVSAWARRAPLLWAVLPLVAVNVLEAIVFQTSRFCGYMRWRLLGPMTLAFTVEKGQHDIHRLSQLEPLRFLGAPGLWLGLLVAAAFLAAAIRLRRRAEPV